MSGIDAGDHEMEYDPVSDKINDMVEDFTHSKQVQHDITLLLRIIDANLFEIETAVRTLTGIDSWQYPIDGDLKALRCAIETYLDKPVKRGK